MGKLGKGKKSIAKIINANDSALTTVDNVKHQLNQGRLFRFDHRFVSIGAAATVNLQLKIPACDIHLVSFTFDTDSTDLEFSIIEGPTVTDGTTPVPVGNLKRDSAITCSLEAYSNPSAISGGLELFPTIIKSSVLSVGSQNIAAQLLIFKQNTDYVLRITNNAGAGVFAEITTILYEPEAL